MSPRRGSAGAGKVQAAGFPSRRGEGFSALRREGSIRRALVGRRGRWAGLGLSPSRLPGEGTEQVRDRFFCSGDERTSWRRPSAPLRRARLSPGGDLQLTGTQGGSRGGWSATSLCRYTENQRCRSRRRQEGAAPSPRIGALAAGTVRPVCAVSSYPHRPRRRSRGWRCCVS